MKSSKNIGTYLKNPKIQIVILLVIITIAIVFLWYTYYFAEKQRQITLLEQELTKQQQTLQRIMITRVGFEKLRKAVAQREQELQALRAKFPDQKELPNLIRDITRVAQDCGIYTVSFVPQKDVTREYYVENSYQISMLGGFHALAKFFSDIANFELIINISDVDIRSNPGVKASIAEFENHGGIINTVIATFKMTTFSSKK